VLRISLFGGLELRLREGTHVRPLRVPAQRLLAYLALNAGRTVHKDDTARKVWGHGGDDSLRKALKELRDVLRDADAPSMYLETVAGARGRHGTIRLHADRLWVDALEFESLQPTAPAEALTLYRGDLIAPVQHPGEWLTAKRTRFQRLAAEAHGRLAEDEWQAGRAAEAILHAERGLEIGQTDVGALRILAGYVAEHRGTVDAAEFVERYLADRQLNDQDRSIVVETLETLETLRRMPPTDRRRDEAEQRLNRSAARLSLAAARVVPPPSAATFPAAGVPGSWLSRAPED
jgi:DNA-binding SARP family transcriptional activator